MRHQPKTAAALALCLGMATMASAMTYQITVIDEIPGGPDTGQPFSPPIAVVHGSNYSQWAPGSFASPGLELVAREGDPSILAMEAQDSPYVSDVVIGSAGPFFDQVTFTVEGDPGRLFSVAWMLGRTNDLFSGLRDVVLPAIGTMELEADVWDSGTEVNTGMIEYLGFYGHPNTGPDEDNPISSIGMYTIYNDPDHPELSWTFPPGGHVTIQAMGTVPTQETTWGAVKSLYSGRTR